MKWNIFKVIQLCCWLISITLIILSITGKYHFAEDPEKLLELLGLLSAASLVMNEAYERWLEKYSAANVLAVGYIKNFIEPVMESQYRQQQDQPKSFTVKVLYILMPERIAEINSIALQSFIAKAKLESIEISIPVIMRNRNNIDINEINNSETQACFYLDTPNTISSLEALIDYKLAKKANSKNEAARQKPEKKYLGMFKDEMQRLIDEKSMRNDVKIITSVDKLP
jgi:hypothetical protein